ncbi:helix-turn-helix domain-containing protein [Halomarina ordinaria]|uniref:Helix-turn-helix domain-containing protein n=1 Tax=Halomarina ordinaria TaxID=3033939 RepID=A0ABD5U708_9EURY|nr:helix-turn-helix domain-containing protein [Halomarina sp. PSRA2]
MATLVTGDIDVADVALAETFTAVPDLVVTAEETAAARSVATPLLHLESQYEEDLEETIAADSSVETATEIARTGDRRLYHVSWGPKPRVTFQTLTREGGTLLGFRGTAEGWHVNLLYPTRQECSEAVETFRSADIDFTVDSVSDVATAEGVSPTHLTDDQCDTLRLAYRRGYFDIPRKVNLEELAEELGISHQACSERIRRALDSTLGRIYPGEAGQRPVDGATNSSSRGAQGKS